LLVFDFVRRDEEGMQSRTPLSKELQPFQRINLYRRVNITSVRMLIQLYDALKTTKGLGSLLIHLECEISMAELYRWTPDNNFDETLANLTPLLSRLRSLEFRRSGQLANFFLQRITDFPELRKVTLDLYTTKYLHNLLKLEHLDDLRLIIETDELEEEEDDRDGDTEDEDEDRELKKGAEDVDIAGSRTLSLKSLNMQGFISQSDVTQFLRSIDAKEIALYGRQGFHPALAAIGSNPTQLTLCNLTSRPQQEFDNHLERFTHLINLNLGGNCNLSNTFFTTFFKKSSISHLNLFDDLDFNAQDLIDGINSTVELTALRLDHVERDSQADAEISEDLEDLLELYPGNGIDDVLKIYEAAEERGITVTGKAIDIWCACEKLIMIEMEAEGEGDSTDDGEGDESDSDISDALHELEELLGDEDELSESD
jgi:hypothetical protein